VNPTPLGPVIAPALGIAISPVSIIAVILLLLSPQARTASLGSLLGWTTGIVAAVTAFALLSVVVPVRVPGVAHTVLAVIQLVVGLLLLGLAAVQWHRRSRPDGGARRTPAWMRAIDSATFPIAFAIGFVMAVNPPNLLLALAGGVAIGVSGPTGSGIVPAIAVFTVVAASTVLIPVAGHLLAAERLRRPLDGARLWLTRYDSAILTVVFVVLGALSAGQGITALSTG
jgi:hypothetical protein